MEQRVGLLEQACRFLGCCYNLRLHGSNTDCPAGPKAKAVSLAHFFCEGVA